MAAADVQTQPAIPGPRFRPIIESKPDKHGSNSVVFSPREHLAFEGMPSRIMMKDIGLDESMGISPVAISQPFRLFSHDAIQQMRAEIFRPEVLRDYQYNSDLAACQLRGYAAKHAPFVFDAWNNPKTLEVISRIAGVELVPNMNVEIGHINISVKSEQETLDELETLASNKLGQYENEEKDCPWKEDMPVVGWHTDSYPFVCVVMLSDCTNMVGGETVLRTGNGDVLKVRGPEMGCAVVMQGRYITHQALRALGAHERITMVTSLRPKSPYARDDSVLTTVRGISDLPELYYEYAQYRLAMLEERVRNQLKTLRDSHEASKKLDVESLKAFLQEQGAFLEHTNQEIIEEAQVRRGRLAHKTT